jgi:DNA mismatch endonuclease, patch repair protein
VNGIGKPISFDAFKPTSVAASEAMRGNGRSGTRPEVRIRSELHRCGLRFRKDYPIDAAGLRVRPDIVFLRKRLAVFVDGCFWHSCPKHGVRPRANSEYWLPKLARNVLRDQEIDRRLAAADWRVLRIWEHVPVDEAIRRISSALGVACPKSGLNGRRGNGSGR